MSVVCGHCGASLPEVIVNCRIDTSGGTYISHGPDGNVTVGRGGAGVRIVRLDSSGELLHECGALSA